MNLSYTFEINGLVFRQPPSLKAPLLARLSQKPLSRRERGWGKGEQEIVLGTCYVRFNAAGQKLCKNATDAERTLWTRLRAHRFHGLKFRRQQPIGRYIVDHYCPGKLSNRFSWLWV